MSEADDCRIYSQSSIASYSKMTGMRLCMGSISELGVVVMMVNVR